MARKITRKSSIKKIRKTVKPKKNNLLGEVTHYFDKINVAVVKLVAPLKVGDYVEFKHGDESFHQIVESIQVDHKNIQGARAGSEIGLKVVQKIKEGWTMLKAEQPSLLEQMPAQAEQPKQFSYKPIFP